MISSTINIAIFLLVKYLELLTVYSFLGRYVMLEYGMMI